MERDFDSELLHEESSQHKQQRALVAQAKRDRRDLFTLFSSPLGEAVLTRLEKRFETHLPVFQGKIGQYDALDAMRRDAHREVFLIIRAQLDLARQEAKPNN